MGQYFLYLRKSRADVEAEKQGEGETLARHERTLLELAKQKHLNIGAVYKEIVSGETIAARPVMQQVLIEVENKMWDGCLVMEVERLARGDSIDQGIIAQTFKLSETKIITPTKTYDPNNEFDEEYFEFGLFMSRREYKTINRRLQQGRLASIKEGKYVGNKTPYGYTRKKLEKGYTLAIVEDEAAVVKMIYNWFVYGLGHTDDSGKSDTEIAGTTTIAKELNRLGIPARICDRWTAETIRGILNNPVYYGYLRWNERKEVKKIVDGQIKRTRPRNKDSELYAGLHPAIISKELADMVQAKRPNSARIRKDYELHNPLAGIIKCSVCNRTMIRRPYYNKKKEKQRDTLICKTIHCKNISSYLDVVENKLLYFLDEWLDGYKVIFDNNSTQNTQEIINSKKKNIDAIDKKLDELNKQLDKVHDMLEQGVYSVEKFLERSKAIEEKTEALKASRSCLSESIQKELEYEKARKELIPTVENVLATYNLVDTPAAKNALLKTILQKVVYTKDKKGIENFNLNIYPKIPIK